MDDIRIKIKEWGQAIRMGELYGIADEIMTTTIVQSTDEINKSMYKLILYLCQTAQQSDKTNTSNGMDILNITCAICFKLTSIPDVAKFFSGMYHIVCHLIDMKLYKETMKLGDFLFPGSLFYSASTDCVNMYAKFSTLWFKTIDKLFTTFQKLDENKFELIIMLINFELKFQFLSLKDGSRYLLNKITIYNEKIKSFGQQEFLDKFQSTMMDYIMKTKMSLGVENKFQTYRSVLRFLNDIIISKITYENINAISDRVKQFFAIFKNCMKDDNECYRCFVIYEQLCQILIRSVEKFTSKHFHAMEMYMNSMNTIILQYGNENAIKWNSYSIIQIIETLTLFWDKYREKCNKKNIEEFISNITALIKHQANIFINFQLSECYCHASECRITVDIYNVLAMKLKALKMIARYIDDLSSNFINITIEIAEECVQFLYDLQAAKCKRWCKIWVAIGSLVHNIAVHYEKTKYEESICLYRLLASVTINLNAFDVESSYVNFDNPLCVALHRLSTTHYIHGEYDNAMIACALNAYIGYNNDKCKAFRFWANIKYKHPSSHGITIVNCLKSNKMASQIIGIDVNLKNCDLVKICLREIKALQEADINVSSSIISVLDFMETIDVSPLIYGQCVQLLGYHMLNFHLATSISRYINKALLNLKNDNKYYTIVHELLKGHLKFYEFIEDLKEMNKITEVEMKNTKITLHARSDGNSNSDPARNVVPSYSLINVKTTIKMVEKLKKILEIWKKCYEDVNANFDKYFESDIMVRTVIIAAEYSRFYQYHNLEIQAWKIAYNLAKKFNNNPAIVYVTGRCISSRHINNEWIQRAENCIEKLTTSTDQTIIETIAMFKLSLSEFYFNMGLITEANQLFEDAVALPNIKFTVNLATYLSSVDIFLSHKFNSDYIENIVKGLYTTLTIDDFESLTRHRREEFLYELDILFQFTDHIALRMNSLISYREICAHLVRRLSIAQKFNAPFHVAECLKNLCFIDLSRNQLEDCEVKLQGLECILMIETVEMSPQSNFPPTPNTTQDNAMPTQIIEPVRDIFQNDTSPILRRKIFVPPNFMSHNEKCKCFYCNNITFQYLVFSCTHIRARLYAFQNYINDALEHFYGAFNIIKKILNLYNENIGVHRYHEIVEYVLFMLDFARFLKHSVPNNSQDGLDIALHAVDVCEKYKITSSPVYFTVRELIFEYRFENVFKNIDYTKFAMPNTLHIDDNKYINEDGVGGTICSTPVCTVAAKSVQSVRRRKTPLLLTLSKVSNTIVDNDEIIMSNLRQPTKNIADKKKIEKVRPIRREIFNDDYSSNETTDEFESKQMSEKKPLKTKTIKKEIDNINQKQKSTRTGCKLKKNIFPSSDESSEDLGDIDRIDGLMEKIQISESNFSKSDNGKARTRSYSKTKLPLNNISSSKNGKYSIYGSTTRKLSNGQKSNLNNISIPINSSSELSNESNSFDDNIASSAPPNISLSIKSSSKLSNNTSHFERNDKFNVSPKNIDSDDNDVIECSIEEPRRSRRLATRGNKS